MLIAAVVLFVLAAIFGLTVLTSILKNQPTPKPAVFIHGGLAATGLLLVILYSIQATESSPTASLVLFIAAAIGGFILFGLDMQKKPLPRGLAILHPLIAVLGLILLIFFLL